jgi:ribosome-associated protein
MNQSSPNPSDSGDAPSIAHDPSDPNAVVTAISDPASPPKAATVKSTESFNPMSTSLRAIRRHGIEDAKRLAAAAARVAMDNKGTDILVIDVSGQSAEFDLFLLVTGQSRRQLHAISEQIDDALEKELGDRRLGIEGYEDSRWIVLDYGNLMIHLFDQETREYYDLESLWADGKVISLESLGLTP